jgi:hypothetical protein
MALSCLEIGALDGRISVFFAVKNIFSKNNHPNNDRLAVI